MVHVAIVLAVALTATGVCARSAAADVTVHVSTVKDQTVQDSQCSLREAVQYATVAPEPDCASGPPSGVVTILVPPGCYRLHGALLFFGNPQVSVVITGSGRGPADCAGDGTVIDAQQSGSVLQLAGSINVTVSDLTLTGGLSCTSCGGGGIANGGNLALDHVTITGNAAAPGADQSTPGTGAAGGVGAGGGGIWNMPSGQLTVTDSSIVGNAAGAGGAGSDGSGDNGGPGGAGGSGGGIFNAGGVVTVSGSTISGNTAGAGGGGGLGDPNATPATAGGQGGAGGDGGGIATIAAGGNAGRLTVRNSTVAGNFAGSEGAGGLGSPSGAAGLPGGGGGIRATSATLLANVTVAGNSASGTGDGVDAAGGTLTEFGSIIAANGSGPGAQNCIGTLNDDAYDVTYPFQALSDCPGVVADPRVRPLAMNGGGLATVALGPGSAAIDIEAAGGACPATDERGVARPQNGRCDAGAYESAPPLLTNVSAAATGPNAATVSANVDAYLQDTAVVARYGTTTALGATSQAVDAGAANATVPVTVHLTGLAPATTYHVKLGAANADGAVTSMDVTLTTAPGPPPSGGGAGGSVAPVIANLRQSARRWLPGPRLATLTRARRRAAPIGTTFIFGLDQASSVTLTFTRAAPGRRVNGRCVAPRRGNGHRPPCSRPLVAGALRLAAHPGVDQIRFYGRLSRPRQARLAPGNYTLIIVAVNAMGQRSAPHRLNFTILRP